MKLYEIDAAIMNCIDEETGEIIDLEQLQALELERDAKIEGICCWIKNLKAERDAVKAEKMALSARQSALDKKVEDLTAFVSKALNGAKFSTGKVAVSYRKSQTLEIADGVIVPEQYLKYKEPEIDKAGLKDAIKKGEIEIDGVQLVEHNNLQIK